MKKLLTLFLTLSTLFTFGQSTLDYSAVNSVTQVGDTLIVQFGYTKDAQLGDATLTQFDFQYNNKLLGYISHTFQVTSTSAQKARNSWNGFKFNIDSSKSQTDFDGQYISWLSNAASYSSNQDWSVERITIQDATGYPTGEQFITYSFKIKDKGLTNYSDYTNLIQANWVNYKESNGTQINTTGPSTFTLTNIQGGDAGNVVLNVFSNVITNNIGDGSHYGYTIYTKSDFDAGVTQNTPVVASGTFDSAGQATITGLVNDTQYQVSIFIDSQQTYLDQVVTVSDLGILFQQAIGAGSTPDTQSTAFDYSIQKLLGNVVGDMGANSANDFQDSFEVLAHLQGITSNNNPRISKTGMGFNVSGIKSTFGDRDNNGNPTFNGFITPTDSNKSFDFAHALIGDVNFSHSYQPTSQLATIASLQSKSISINKAKYQAEISNLDLVSKLVNGKVEFEININTPDMVGAQFNIEYDTTKLKLENVIFNTGNEMTNFSNHIENEGKINVGSFDQNFKYSIQNGTPYKLIFLPIQQINNTAGLITFKVTEGVKTDGTQIKFQIN
jgi:hypothetical protein